MTLPSEASPAGASERPDLRQWVREIPDFPKPGILFRDLTPMMRDPRGWQEAMDAMVAKARMCPTRRMITGQA